MTHTPGPWIKGKSTTYNIIYDSASKEAVAIALYRLGGEDATITEANARLIAAAPLLLEACKAALEGDYILLRAAIRAAEGGEP